MKATLLLDAHRLTLALSHTSHAVSVSRSKATRGAGPVPTDVDLDQFIPDEARLERAYYADLDANRLWEIKYQTSTQGQGELVQQRSEIVDLDPGPSQQILRQYGINGTARRWPTILFLGWDGSRATELFVERESFGSKGPNLKDHGFSLIYPQFADEDPQCCPSVCFLTDYRWQDDGLVEVASERQEPCVGEQVWGAQAMHECAK